MNPFEMVVLIIAIVTIGRIIQTRNRGTTNREELGTGPSGSLGADNAALRDDVRQLKERIQVLERVITDNHKSVDLDREIERLRNR